MISKATVTMWNCLILISFVDIFTFVEPHGNLIIPYSWLDTDGKGMTISPSKIGEDIGITGTFGE